MFDLQDVEEAPSSDVIVNEIEKVKKAHPGVFDFSSNKVRIICITTLERESLTSFESHEVFLP